MARYTHLSQDERYTIKAGLNSSPALSKREIARQLNRSVSSISREIKRNKGLRGYRPPQAQRAYIARRRKNQTWYTSFAYAYIEHLLSLKWSPEQIMGRLRAMGWTGVPSHEWIYKYIYKNKSLGGILHKNLRAQKTYCKRGGKGNDRRGQIPDRTSIHERPTVIDERSRVGDFEGDTVIGANHRGALLTLVDRKSLFTLLAPLPSKHAGLTATKSKVLLKSVNALSVTFDNGKEFSQHMILRQAGIDTYFADPYHSNQRARNENTNGLIRQYLPKKTSFVGLTDEVVLRIQDALNNRPRKTLDWKTPSEVLSSFGGVAL